MARRGLSLKAISYKSIKEKKISKTKISYNYKSQSANANDCKAIIITLSIFIKTTSFIHHHINSTFSDWLTTEKLLTIVLEPLLEFQDNIVEEIDHESDEFLEFERNFINKLEDFFYTYILD